MLTIRKTAFLGIALAIIWLAFAGVHQAAASSAESLAGSRAFCEKSGPAVPAGAGTTDGILSDVTHYLTVFNTDFTVAGVGGMRDYGYGDITLSGVSGTITEAYLYWNGPTNSTDSSANAYVTVNGTAVVGTNIGFSDDNCWGYDNSQSYRADVTALVQATGNGTYALTNFGSGSVNSNGASLVVFFDDGDDNNNRDAVVFDGNDSNIENPYDAPGWNVTLSGIDYDSGMVYMQLHVADGQEYVDDALILNGATLDAGPLIFQGNSVPSDNNGPLDNGNLWDIKTYDVTASLTPGDNTLTLKHFRYVFGVGFEAVKDTIVIAGLSTPISGLLGMIIAFLVVRKKFPGKNFMEISSLLSFAVPGTVVGIGYILAFNQRPFLLTGTLAILLLNFIFRYIPVGIQSGIAVLRQVDPSIEEAAVDLGADAKKTFRKITLPLMIPAFFSGLIYSFVRAMTAISAAIFLVSSNWNLMTVQIMSQVNSGRLGAAASFSLVLVVIILFAILIIRSLISYRYGKLGGTMLKI